MSLLKNKIAVVTGGSSGIGLATAKRFVEEGAYVFIAGRRQAELDKAVAEIGKNVTGVKADISKLDDLDRLYETVAKKGKIDVIFADAAFVEKMMTAAATPEHFDKTFNTNARGTYFTVQKALPHLNDGASIILVASAGKNKGFPGRSTYSATKAALRSFARTWTSEFKDRKIRTNVLSPGPVDTPMFDGQFPSKEGAAEARKQITAMIPLARLGTPRRDRRRSFVPRLGPKQLRRRYRPAGRRRPDGCLDVGVGDGQLEVERGLELLETLGTQVCTGGVDVRLEPADETTSPAIGGTRTDSGKASSGLSACPQGEDARLQRPAAAAEIAETGPRMPKTMFKRGFICLIHSAPTNPGTRPSARARGDGRCERRGHTRRAGFRGRARRGRPSGSV